MCQSLQWSVGWDTIPSGWIPSWTLLDGFSFDDIHIIKKEKEEQSGKKYTFADRLMGSSFFFFNSPGLLLFEIMGHHPSGAKAHTPWMQMEASIHTRIQYRHTHTHRPQRILSLICVVLLLTDVMEDNREIISWRWSVLYSRYVGKKVFEKVSPHWLFSDVCKVKTLSFTLKHIYQFPHHINQANKSPGGGVTLNSCLWISLKDMSMQVKELKQINRTILEIGQYMFITIVT